MQNTINRKAKSRELRNNAAEFAYSSPLVDHINNDDESICAPNGSPNYIGNFTKGLNHNEFGEVEPADYHLLVNAINSGRPDDFEKIPQAGGPNARKFVNPQAGLAFDLQGPDSHAMNIPPAPCLNSEEIEAEIAELYWMALLRDVPFTEFNSHPLAIKAANSLSGFAEDFTHLKDKKTMTVSAGKLFRGFTKGDKIGPYISQFMLLGNDLPFKVPGTSGSGNTTARAGYIKFGTQLIRQKQYTVEEGVDYMTDPDSWLKIQNGEMPAGMNSFEDNARDLNRFIITPRDLAHYVHFDQLYQAYFNACLILLGMKAPFDNGNPYMRSKNQDGFGTFGGTHILSLVTEVATRALKAVWFQKWFNHRRLRPEAFAGLVHFKLTAGRNYPVQTEKLSEPLDGDTKSLLDLIWDHNVAQNSGGAGSLLLPQAFPEGSPMHPAYGAGHATVAGACVTVLKAFFNESHKIANPVVPSIDGERLIDYTGDDMDQITVGGELNKLAANIAIGRNMGGVHWRTDYTKSLELGEKLAIGILREQSLCYNEDHYFSLTKFDGTGIRI